MKYSIKDYVIALVSVLVVLCFISEPLIAELENVHMLTGGPEYVLDQYQINGVFKENIHSKVSLAQSFTPTVTPLTKIEVKIEKPRKTTSGLVLSIRHTLTSSDLVVYSIPADDIPYYTNWIECDIRDLDVVVGSTYYIILRSSTSSEYPYRWIFEYDDLDDIYSNGSMYRYYIPSDHWEMMQTELDFIDVCFRTYSYIPIVDLVGEGFMNWTDVKPGQDNLTGFFTVRNNGTPYSRLDWKITQWPSWGNWTFSKSNGSGLRPEDGSFVVNVYVVAPTINVPDEYTGKIVIVNAHDENDTVVIQAQLVTRKAKDMTFELCPIFFAWQNLFNHLNRYQLF